MKRIVINPVTRISGFMEIDATIENNAVADVKTEGLLFRGFEKMLAGRSPLDAIYFTERICGICSTAHATASAIALEDAMGIIVSDQGRMLRDITHACEFLQNHIRHFYQYTIPDFVKLPEGNPLFETHQNDFRLPKQKNDVIVQHYFDSLEISRAAHEMLAVFGGKAPHNHGIFVGGITAQATTEKISHVRSLLQSIKCFINEKMIPDAYTIASGYNEYYGIGRGYGNLLSYGCFNGYEKLGTLYVNPLVYINGKMEEFKAGLIEENISYSWYEGNKDTYAPLESMPDADMNKKPAYSWVKAARYKGLPCEVGPLARMWLSGEYRHGISAMDRILARVLEARKIVEIMIILLADIIPEVSVQKELSVPESATGAGLIDTTRGALGHWIKIDNGVISFYQVITPSVWNLSPKSGDGLPGTTEKALIGTYIKDIDNSVELGRILRSFDPCVSCATHVYSRGKLIRTLQVVP